MQGFCTDCLVEGFYPMPVKRAKCWSCGEHKNLAWQWPVGWTGWSFRGTVDFPPQGDGVPRLFAGLPFPIHLVVSDIVSQIMWPLGGYVPEPGEPRMMVDDA
jgi:hypothetical protein